MKTSTMKSLVAVAGLQAALVATGWFPGLDTNTLVFCSFVLPFVGYYLVLFRPMASLCGSPVVRSLVLAILCGFGSFVGLLSFSLMTFFAYVACGGNDY